MILKTQPDQNPKVKRQKGRVEKKNRRSVKNIGSQPDHGKDCSVALCKKQYLTLS